MTDIHAHLRFLPMSAQKVRLVVDLVRGKNANEALEMVFAETPEEQLIDQAIAKRLRIRGKPKNPVEAKSWFDHLLRQGFQFELVSEKVRTLAADYADED